MKTLFTAVITAVHERGRETLCRHRRRWVRRGPADLTAARLAALLGALAVALDLLWLALIDLDQLVPRPVLRVQELVELGLYGLGITVLGALNEQRHQPGR